MSLNRFKGALVGAVVADCIGALFEGCAVVEMSDILHEVEKLKKSKQPSKDENFLYFTDDTAMARSVANSLLEKGGFHAQDMAHKFADEYDKEPGRGYGGNVVTVFKALFDRDLSDVFEPARLQFKGSGSYGNGGAMRIVPAPLFTFHDSDKKELQKLVTSITRLTHTHHQAVQGAILQAFAVDQSLRLSQDEIPDANKFIDDLVCVMKPIEESSKSPSPPAKRKLDEDATPYCAKLEKIKDFVQRDELSAKAVAKELGNDVSALGSVPAAVLAFLRGSIKPIKGLKNKNRFESVVLYAISLGGDTDTIATMAAGMAGAVYGIESIPEEWMHWCEGVTDAETAAKKLYERNIL